MAIKVAINGFGRIGRMVFQALCDQGLLGKEIDVVAVVDISTDADYFAYQMKYDSVHGQLQAHVATEEERRRKAERTTCSSSTATRSSASWRPRTRASCPGRRWASTTSSSPPACSPTPRRPRATSPPAPRRSSSPPPARARSRRCVMGVNENEYDPAKHNIVSNASCTTNCLAPVVHVLLKEGIGIETGLMTTIHCLHRHPEDRRRPVQEGLARRPRGGDQHHPLHHRRRQGRRRSAARRPRAS